MTEQKFYDVLARDEWKGQPLLIWGFECPLMIGAPLTPAVDVGSARVCFGSGSLQYLQTDPNAAMDVDAQGQARFRTKNAARFVSTDNIGFSLLVTAGDGDQSWEVLADAEAMLVATGGRAAVFRKLFENVVFREQSQTTGYARRVENPAWWIKPDISNVASRADQIHVAIAAQPTETGNRIRLALRWLVEAARNYDEDGFLRYWIAVETLAMPDTTNIRPAEEMLAAAYSVTVTEARTRFALGRLFGLRSRIVHDGLRLKVPAEIGRYMEGVFFDLLSQQLGLASERRAEEHLTAIVISWLTAQLA